MKAKEKMVLWLVIAVVAALCVNVNAAPIITASSAWASSELFGLGTSAYKVLDTSRLNGSNQLIVGDWSNNWLSSDGDFTSYQWLVVDLGASYNVDEIRIWNYFDNAVSDESGRGYKDFNLYLGNATATLPIAGVVGNPFATTGWTYSIGAGTLAKAPLATVPIGPTDVLKAGVNFASAAALGARYIGIDMGAYMWNGSGGGQHGGLAQIQVTGIPEPATLALLCLGGIAALRRRRA